MLEKKVSNLEKNEQNILFRVIGILGFLLFLGAIAKNIFLGFNYLSEHFIFISKEANILFKSVISLLFCLLIIFPNKIGFLSFASLSYATYILLEEPSNHVGILFYFLAVITIIYRKLFQRKTKIVVIFLSILFLFLLFSEIRIGLIPFIPILFEKLEILFLLIIICVTSYLTFPKIFSNNKEHYLDLTTFTDLTDTEREWLKLVATEMKYDTIAKQYNISNGTFRNKMHEVYKKIGFSDRISFLSTYGGYDILITKEDVERVKSSSHH